MRSDGLGMREKARIALIIPALDEAESIKSVLAQIPSWVDDIVVVDNGSVDATSANARAGGALVVSESTRGYGAAMQAGIRTLDDVDIVVFMDADGSDYPGDMASLVDPIVAGPIEFSIGSRVLGIAQTGSLTAAQRLGNRFACVLMRVIWGARYTDLGPFRAIAYRQLMALRLKDKGFGWNVEMQIQAMCQNLRVVEVPVSYRCRRQGKSKISGHWWGSVIAGLKILTVIATSACSSTYLTSDNG